MLSRYTREFNRIYIDGAPVTGAQSISASYNLPYERIKYLGSNINELTTAPIGVYVGAFNIDSLFVNSDQFIKYTGDFGANIKIEYDGNLFAMNSGYMAEYDFNCAIGTIPIISTKWNIYDNFGSGIYTNSPFKLENDQLNIVNPGDIELNFPELTEEKVNNLTINIRSPRLPIYEAVNLRPVEVKLQYPLSITTSFAISLHNYKNKNLFDYPRKNNTYSFTINLKKHNTSTVINTFNINNALLTREDYSSDVDGSSLMQLTYESIITR